MLQLVNRCACATAAVLALCASVCCANPVIGTQTPICPTFNPARGNQDSVEIAAGSDGYLAVWHDTRGTDSDIFATRISSTGVVLDQASIAVCQCSGDQLDPAVAWNGREYLVVWSDRRGAFQNIYAARVRPTGEVIDKQGICLSGTTAIQAFPRVASDGSGWEVVWQDSRGGTQDIYGCKFGGDGSVGRAMGISTQSGNNEENPDIAYNGSNFLVVWRDQRNSATTDSDIYGCRVAKTGLRMGSDILISCDSTGSSGVVRAQQNPRVARCGSDWMAVWEDYRVDASNADIYCARVSSAGTVLDKNGKAVATGTAIQEIPGIGYDGTRLLIAWRDRTNRYIRGARVTTSGSVSDPSGFNIYLGTAGSDGVGVAGWSGGGFRVTWNNLSMAGTDAFVSFVPGTGTVTGSYGTTISLGQDDQPVYSVADNGTDYAVAWSQQVSGKSCILAARVSRAGQIVAGPVNLTATLYGQQVEPSIAWNGSQYLVVWSDDQTYETSGLDIRGFRLDGALHAKEVNPIVICSVVENQTAPCVTSNGNKFLVVWEDTRNAISPTYYNDAYGAFVDANGTVTTLGSAVNMSSGNQKKLRAASNGTDYYVVWEDSRMGYTQAYGVRITSSGSVGSATGTAMPATSYSQTDPDVCYGNGYYFATWTDGTRICGCRISTTGTITDTSGINIDSGSAAKGRPCARWDGANYQVVWEDYRSAFAGNSDIYYTTVGGNGVVSTDPKPALVSDLLPQYRPRIFGDTTSGILFYQNYECYANGLCAAPITQQGLQEVPNIKAAKSLPTGSLIVLRGKIVTAVFAGYFYIEEADRSSAIKVVSNALVHVGDVVDVTGVIGTSDGERQLTTGSVTAMGVASDPLRPFGMRGDVLGGAALGGAPGITGAVGTNNIGLLVKTWGKVTSVTSDYFYIEAKPGTTVKVKSGALTEPALNKFVAVTGISSCEVSSGAVCRAIVPRQQTDIQVLN